MKTKVTHIVVLLFCLLFMIPSVSTSEEINSTEAINFLKEYKMLFDKYDSQSLLNISSDETSPSFPYMFFAYENEDSPLDAYEAYLCINTEGEGCILEPVSTDYSGKIYAFFGIHGRNDLAFPFFQLFGDDITGKPIKKIDLSVGDKHYSIEYKNNDWSYIQDGMFNAVCYNMFEMEIELLMELSNNNLNMEVDILFQDNQTLRTILQNNISESENPAALYLQTLKDSNYIDQSGHIQADIVYHFPSISTDMGKKVVVKNENFPADKGYSLFGEKYGLEMTTNGDAGATKDGSAWFIANVKNKTEDKTIDGFDLVYYGTNVYGDIINFEENAKLVYNTFVKDIKPGKNYSTDKVYFYDPSQKPKIIHAAIRRIHYTDGTLIEIPLRDLSFYDFEITY